MDQQTRDKIKTFIRDTLTNQDILKTEFKSLRSFFKMLDIKTPSNHVKQYNNMVIDSILTSLLVYYENHPEEVVDMDNHETKNKINERICEAIEVAKTTFAFMVSKFSENDLQNPPDS